MLLVDRLAEEQIAAAVRRGELDDLPGAGRPLALEDDSAVPGELRVAYRLLKNAGCLPPELSLRGEIRSLEALLERVDNDAERLAASRRLSLLRARLAARGGEASLLLAEGEYRARLLRRMDRPGRAGVRGA